MSTSIVKQRFINADGSYGDERILTESLNGSRNFDTIFSGGTQGYVPGIVAQENRVRYTPEAKRTVNPMQLIPSDTTLYFHPNYRFCIDGPFGDMSVADRLKIGINCFNASTNLDSIRSQIPAKSGMYYLGESGVHNGIEGWGFYNMTLEQYEAHIQGTFEGVGQPYGTLVNFGTLHFNIETSQPFMAPGNLGQPAYPGFSEGGYFGTGHFPDWNSAKNQSVFCLNDGVTRTWEQLAQLGPGAWYTHMYTDFANKAAVMILVAKAKSAVGCLITYGTSMKQGYPLGEENGGLFVEGNCDVTRIGGNNQGNITLNGRAYKLPHGKSFYSLEDFDQGYWYKQAPGLGYTDSSWQNTNNYRDLWGKIVPEHCVANDKGYWQGIRTKMRLRRADQTPVPLDWQEEFIYEGNLTRCPFPYMQNAKDDGFPGGETPKMMQPPANMFSKVVASRFLSGNDAFGNGLYFFPFANYTPATLTKPLSDPAWNRWDVEMHGPMAAIQARIYMQPYERWFTGTTLVEDIEINVNGSFQAINGIQAYAGGNTSNMKPTGSARFKTLANGSIEVAVMIGMRQDFGVSRTDQFRIPGLAGNNTFAITYANAHARVFRFTLPAGTSNQNINLGNLGVGSWEPSGYAGRTQFLTA